MKLMKTEDAVGQMLCHDMTQIIPGEFKGPLFRKGHIITEEDIPLLLSIGKDHIYVWEVNENMLHENDAAEVLYDICPRGSEELLEEPEKRKMGGIQGVADPAGHANIPGKAYQDEGQGKKGVGLEAEELGERGGEKGREG